MKCPEGISKTALGWTGEKGKDKKGKFVIEYKAVADKKLGPGWEKIQEKPDHKGRFVYKRKNYEMSR